MNYLSPNVNRGNFTEEEDDLIIRLHKLLGNRFFNVNFLTFSFFLSFNNIAAIVYLLFRMNFLDLIPV